MIRRPPRSTRTATLFPYTTLIRSYYVFDGTFSNDQYELPGTGAQLGNLFLVSPGTTPDPRGVVDPELDPMFQDELILGFQVQLTQNWMGGVRGFYRKLSTVMDDYISEEHTSELQSLMRTSYAVF